VNPIRLLEDLDFLEHVALDLVEHWARHVFELPAWATRPEACPHLFVGGVDKLSLLAPNPHLNHEPQTSSQGIEEKGMTTSGCVLIDTWSGL
jgi:hypothetical protein